MLSSNMYVGIETWFWSLSSESSVSWCQLWADTSTYWVCTSNCHCVFHRKIM